MPEAAAAVYEWWRTAIVVGGVTVGTYGGAVIVGAMVYGSMQQRSAARKMAQAQRDAYNASLTDRTVSVVSADNPWPIVLGEATVGPSYVAILTSGGRDEYKHVAAVWAAHQCDSIVETMMAGVAVGALDGSGYATTGRWAHSETRIATETLTVSSGAVTLAHTPTNFLGMTSWGTGGTGDEGISRLTPDDVTVSGTTVTLHSPHDATWAGWATQVSYEYVDSTSVLRLKHYLGTDSQTADAATIAEVPADWSSTDRGRGLCHTMGRFDLNEPEFQGGPPQWTARLRGVLCYDPRLDGTQPGGSGPQRLADITTWTFTRNVALIVARFLMAEWGKRARANQVIWPSVVAAANVCDETLTVDGDTYARYTCNGRFTTADDPDVTLDQLCQAMAGFATFMGGAWYVEAGSYSSPVMDLTDADNMGSVEVVPSPASSELLNGLRGRYYAPDQYGQLTDYTPYRNASFVADDGAEYFDDLDLPFTDADWRCQNLARIQVERSRGMQLVYPAKMRAIRLRPGNRVRLSCSPLGLTTVVFRVMKREYQVGGPVKLTLVFDDPSFYDEADAPTPLVPGTASATNPYQVAPVDNLRALTGLGVVLRDGDGTVIARVKLTYDASADITVQGHGTLQVEYRMDVDTAWQRAPAAPGDSTECYVPGLLDQRPYVIRARWNNGLASSAWRAVFVLTNAPALPAPAAPAAGVVTGLDIDVPGGGDLFNIAAIKFCTDGAIRVRTGRPVIYRLVESWYYPNTVGIGSSYWIKVTTQGGSTAPQVGTVGSWLALSSDRLWSNTASTPGDAFLSDMDFEISTSSTGTPVVASGSFHLDTAF